MNLLFNVVYAAHAKGTHHKLALDALRLLEGPESEHWRRLFLKYSELYLQGAKAPDNEFKDFKNHVLHVRDGYWGGAVEKVESWYNSLVKELAAEHWSEAVYAAGILSHYYTDPIHPFHTAQSEAENNIHRAAEWSISRSYGDLFKLAQKDFAGLEVAIGAGPHWLRELVCHGAETGNRSYEKLIAHYDINRGVVDPPAGLDSIGRRLVAELIAYATNGFARVLEHAFVEAKVAPPNVGLTIETLLATLTVPFKLISKRMENAEERRLIERMYDELRTTGRVELSLPEDDRVVRDLHAKEVLAPRQARLGVRRTAVVCKKSVVAAPRAGENGPVKAPPALAHAPGAVRAAVMMERETPAAAAPESVPVAAASPVTVAVAPAPVMVRAAVVKPAPVTNVVAMVKPAASREGPRLHLAVSDDLERAPSIGPKTAERFAAFGIKTVAEFLAGDPDAMAAKLDTRHITPETLRDWQDQSRLVASVPGLRGTHAQLLVGAGYRSVDALAAAEVDKLCAAVLAFRRTRDGQRVLRDGAAPDIERIKGWLESARSVRAA